MKLPNIGKSLWVGRFSPNTYKEFQTEENGYKQPTKDDIFIRPFKAVISQMYLTHRKGGKWILILESTSSPVIKWNTKPCGSENHKVVVGSAALLGKPRAPLLVTNNEKGSAESFVKLDKYSNRIELEVQIKNGKIVSVSDDYIVTLKRTEILKKVSQRMRKFWKVAKSNHKYSQMNMIQSCLFDVHNASHLERMIQKNPENFI